MRDIALRMTNKVRATYPGAQIIGLNEVWFIDRNKSTGGGWKDWNLPIEQAIEAIDLLAEDCADLLPFLWPRVNLKIMDRYGSVIYPDFGLHEIMETPALPLA